MQPIQIPASTNPKVPQPSQPFRHRLPMQIRFNDIDALGHLNNSIYLQFMDLGKAAYFSAVMPERIDWKRVNIVVVNINCDFYAPTYFHEPIEVLTTVTAISERSLKIEQRVINSKSGEVKCIGHTVMAGFDPATAQGAPIEQTWVEAISAFEERDFARS